MIVNDEAANNGGKGIKYRDLAKEWTEEEIYKFWHNYNVITIFNAYSAWVDTMYDCGYARAETISIAGKKRVVENPLDPTCYYMTPVYVTDKNGGIVKDDNGNKKIDHYEYDGRPMIFSKSEMKYYGLEWKDLTKVEQKIIRVAENVYEKAIDLMNYYTFDDNVLVSAYSMLQLFEFNKEFSQVNPIGTSYIMYPQGYELKAFTYDAYLRLILSNTTGDSLQDKDSRSLYERTMEDSSITFGVLFIILDIICIYIIPAFKVFFLVVLFLLSIVMIIASAVKIELNMVKVTWKSLARPLLGFCAVSISLSLTVSLFMSNGAKGVTGDLTPTIKLGDPTMVTAVMIFINACALYLYWKICRQVAKDLVTYARIIANSIGGTVYGAIKSIGNIVASGGAGSKIGGAVLAGGAVGAMGGGGALGAIGGIALASGVASAVGGRKAQGSYDPRQASKNNLPKQRPQHSENTKGRMSTNRYEDRIQSGKKKRSKGRTADYGRKNGMDRKRGIKATLEDVKRGYGDKAKTYGERANSQKEMSESIKGSNALLGEQVAGVGVGIASKKNAFLEKQYFAKEKAVGIALKPVQAVGNAKKKGAGSVNNLRPVRAVRKNMSGYKAVMNKANGGTDRKINSYKKKGN